MRGFMPQQIHHSSLRNVINNNYDTLLSISGYSHWFVETFRHFKCIVMVSYIEREWQDGGHSQRYTHEPSKTEPEILTEG